jgi:hypothetical protein
MTKGIFSKALIVEEFFKGRTLTPKQQDLIWTLIQLWEKYPEQRFGQLLFNCTRFGTRTEVLGHIADIFHYQDRDILDDLIKEMERK